MTPIGDGDAELIARLVDHRDADAFDLLYRRHTDAMYASALRIAADPDIASDAVHDAWVRAVENLGRFERRSALRTWLIGIFLLLPTFLIAASEQRLVMGTDWLDASERVPLAPIQADAFRVGELEWSPERLHFDTVLDGCAHRAVYSGTPYFRSFTA